MTQWLALVLLWLLFFPVSAHADGVADMRKIIENIRANELIDTLLIPRPSFGGTHTVKAFNWDEKTFCSDGELGVFWNSTHPGGNQNGKHNEKNRGIFFVCPIKKYWDGHLETYSKFGGLHNSQMEDASIFGVGARIETPELYYVKVGFGGEVHRLQYRNSRGITLVGFLPIATVDVTVRIPGFCSFKSIQHHLADTGVKLYARKFICEYKFR